MEKNTKVQVKANHKFHSNKTGYFQFEGMRESKGCFVFATKEDVCQSSLTLFVVGKEDFAIAS